MIIELTQDEMDEMSNLLYKPGNSPALQALAIRLQENSEITLVILDD